ncbi:MAG TPA: NUDIX domain-containing protein [Verrucomicrobiae bacterium]|nr:NUDIX domain-containing protein [Verrucomicrobiae bacterium]
MRINVSVIVTHNKQVLLMQRSLTDDYFAGAWGIPGGYMEPDEMYLEETAIRETMEEMGVRIKPTGVIANNRNNDTDTFYLVVSAELENPDDYPKNIKLSEEANDFKWVGKDEIDNLEFTPYTIDRVRKALAEA